MQIRNFYVDPVPSIRSPLDSIVLSPHTIKSNDFSLTGMKEDYCDYQTLLPSISSCQYYDRNACMQTKSLPKCIWAKCCRFIKKCHFKKGKS
jgi:hypothetical protein